MRFMIVLEAMGGTEVCPFGKPEMVGGPGRSTALGRLTALAARQGCLSKRARRPADGPAQSWRRLDAMRATIWNTMLAAADCRLWACTSCAGWVVIVAGEISAGGRESERSER